MNPLHVLVAIEDRCWHVLDLESGESQHRIPVSQHPWEACQISEEYVATTGDDENVTLYRISDWESVATLRGHSNNTRGIRYLPTSNQLVTGSIDETIRIWNFDIDETPGTGTGECVATLNDPDNNTWDVEHFPIFPTIVCSGSDDDHVYVWDFEQNQVLHKISYGDDPRTLGRDDERCILFTGDDDNEIRYLDVRNGYTEVRRLRGHSGYIRSLTYRVQSNQLVFPCQSGEIYVYDVRNDSEKVHSFSGHASDHSAYGCCDIVNQNAFVTTTWDEYVRCWDADSWEKKWEFRSSGDDPRGACTIYSSFGRAGGGVVPSEEVDEEKVRVLVGLGESGTKPWLNRFNARVVADGKLIRTCRSYLSIVPGMTKTGLVEISSGLGLSAEALLSLLAGDHSKIEPKFLLDVFLFFYQTELMKHAYLVCKILEGISETNLLIYLLAKAFEAFDESTDVAGDDDDLAQMMADDDEKEEEDGETQESAQTKREFKSPFTLALANVLKDRIEEITKKSPTMAEACRSRGLFGPLMFHRPSPVHEHVAFGWKEEDCPKSFAELTRAHLHDLLRTGRHANFALAVPSPMGTVTFPAHLDILCLRHPTFMDCLKDDHVLATLAETNEIISSDFPPSEVALRAVLEGIYGGSMQADEFESLLPLWTHALIQNDEALKDAVIKRIKELTRDYARDKRLVAEISKVVHFLTDAVIEDASKIWSQVGRERLVSMRSAALTKGLADGVGRLEEKTESRFEVVEDQIRDMHEMAGQMLDILRKRE